MAPAVPSPSSSLVLLNPLKNERFGQNFEVLMLKRNAKASAFSSAHVFPGGNIDKADSAADWDELLPGVTNDEERINKICCIRETFEECGVLLAKNATKRLDSAERKAWRKKVHANAAEFISLFKMLNCAPDLERLALRGRWITPRDQKKRFLTNFFFAMLPDDVAAPGQEEPIAIADRAETTIAEWLTPKEAIELCVKGSIAALRGEPDTGIVLITPQFYHLGEMPDRYETLLNHQTGFIRSKACYYLESENVKADSTIYLPGDHKYSLELPTDFPKFNASTAEHRSFVLHGAKGPPRTLGFRRRGMEAILGPGYEDFTAGLQPSEMQNIKSKL